MLKFDDFFIGLFNLEDGFVVSFSFVEFFMFDL